MEGLVEQQVVTQNGHIDMNTIHIIIAADVIIIGAVIIAYGRVIRHILTRVSKIESRNLRKDKTISHWKERVKILRASHRR